MKGKQLFIAVQIALFFMGLFLVTLGILGPFSWKEIPLNIGITFIAASFIAFFNNWLLSNDSDNRLKEWGLVEIYEHRYQKNKKVNSYIKESAAEFDIITQNSLLGLRNTIGDELKIRLECGLKMRILIPSDINDPQHVKDIEGLINWCNDLDRKQRENIEIHSYDGIPQDLYQRVDNMIFVGPYLLGERPHSNHETITYEFRKDSVGGEIYFNYFKLIWKGSNKIGLKP
jgi:hypothetical protein